MTTIKTLPAVLLGALALATLTGSGSARAAIGGSGADQRVLSFTADVHVQANGDFTERDDEVVEALTRTGAQALNPYQQQFSTSMSTLKVLAAWIQQPDGQRVDIPQSDIYVRPVPATTGAPMYSHAKVLNVVLPHFTKGDTLHVSTLTTQFKPYFAGQYFGVWGVGVDESARDQRIVVHAPASMHLRMARRGDWQTTQSAHATEATFTATLAANHAHYPGSSTVDAGDFSPLFEVTSFPDWAAVGDAYYKEAKPEAAVTPLVQKVADEVAGKLHGWAAVKALYAWDSAHIRYVGLELGVGGYVPVSASETLQTGYGDCKAHSTLLEALLAARGIKVDPVLINWSNGFALAPLPGLDFNHAIDYLPKYHVFLDATGEFETPGQLAIGERDKQVVVASDHSRLMRTPGAEPVHNNLHYAASLALAPDGTLTGSARMVTRGWWAWFNRMIFAEVPPAAYGRLMNQLLATSGGGSGSFQPGDPMILDQPFRTAARWTTPAYAVPGKTLSVVLPAGPYLVPSMAGTSDPVAALAAVVGPAMRRHDISTYLGEIDWQSTLTLPAGYASSYLPPDVDLHDAAGSFRYSIEAHGDSVQARYALRLNHVLYTPAQYAALRKLLLADLRAQRTPLVFHRI